MSVRIPISTDPASVVAAFTAIRNTIQRTGQTAKEFSDLDLSHPELKEVAEDLEKINAQHEVAKRLPGSKLGKRLRTTGQEKLAPWEIDWERMYPDPAQARRGMGNVGGYILQGTRFAPPAPQNKLGDKLERFGGLPQLPGVGGMVKGALALAGLGGLFSMVHSGVKDAQHVAVGTDDFLRHMRDSTADFRALREQLRGIGAEFGVLTTEAAQLGLQYARTANETEPQRVVEATDTAVAWGKGHGVSPSQSTDMFARADWLGVAGRHGMSPRSLAMLVSEAIARSGMFAKSDEVMGSMLRYVERIAASSVQSPDVRQMLQFQAGMHLLSSQANLPGLRGQAGESLLAALDAGIRNPGAGEAGEWAMWRALSPVTDDPAKQQYLRSLGFFGTAKQAGLGDDETPIGSLYIDMIRRESAGLPNKYWTYEQLQRGLNLSSPQQAQWLLQVQDRVGSLGFGRMQKLLEQSGAGSMLDLNESGLHEVGTLVDAGADGLRAIRDRYLKERDLTDEQRQALSTGDTDQLRVELAKIAASQGRMENDGTRVLDVMRSTQSELEKVGGRLLTPLNVIKESMGKLLGVVNRIADQIAPEVEPSKAPQFSALSSGVQGDRALEMLTPGGGEETRRRLDDLSKGRQAPPMLLPETRRYLELLPSDLPTRPQANSGGESGTRTTPADLRRGRLPMAELPSRAAMEELERQHGLPTGLLTATARVESSNDPSAVSPAGAQGMFQLMPKTAAQYGVADPFDPQQAAAGAARYYQDLYRRFDDWDKAIAAYNAGPTAVRKHDGVPPYPETQTYLDKIHEAIRAYKPEPQRTEVAVTVQLVDREGNEVPAEIGAPKVDVRMPGKSGPSVTPATGNRDSQYSRW